jgi:hypothetical protein
VRAAPAWAWCATVAGRVTQVTDVTRRTVLLACGLLCILAAPLPLDAAGDPAPPAAGRARPATAGARAEPSALEVANLYASVGRELGAATRSDPDAVIDLWPRFRWIRVNDALVDPARRRPTVEMLERIRSELRAILDARYRAGS